MMDTGKKLPLHELMANLAGQLQSLARAGTAIEACVGDEIRFGRVFGNQVRLSLQGLDHIVQSLTELATFVERITPEIDENLVVDVSIAAQLIRLRELSKALTGHSLEVHRLQEPFIPGEVDLF